MLNIKSLINLREGVGKMLSTARKKAVIFFLLEGLSIPIRLWQTFQSRWEFDTSRSAWWHFHLKS